MEVCTEVWRFEVWRFEVQRFDIFFTMFKLSLKTAC